MSGIESDLVMRTAAAEFLRAGRARIPLQSARVVPRVIASVAKLIADPAHDTWGIYVPRPGAEPGDKDDGLIRRSKSYAGDQTTDNKWFFHYRRSLMQHLETLGVDTSGHEDLFDACQELFGICLESVMSFADAYDREMPNLRLKRRLIEAEDPHVLRVLFYDPGALMARPHTDRDALTLHVAESRPGLRIGPDHERYIAPPNEALIFPGQKFERITEGATKALLHDVADGTHGDTPNEPRWSVVFFAHT